ncbi:MAG TPA: gamma-glutamyl-gamma-aminobutyrate hydrolase family protein [Puia sp.]|nr:gamma-glutamyl-gamma-aminobutyrate hydrolase family protein [Puia sp.]
MKKKIGISFSKTNFQNYWNWFLDEAQDRSLELVELSFLKNNIDDIARCDGFILTGGVDIIPALYDGAATYENMEQVFQEDRDRFEEKIFRFAQANSLPLLGICRGLQLVNVLQGGRLIQDLGAANSIHRKVGQVDKEHAVSVSPDSLLYEIIGAQSGGVNSAHHQSIDPDALGDNLRVNALSPDGVVEGIEFDNRNGKSFMVCVQWHPERMKDKEKNPFSQRLRKNFLDAIKNKL